MAKRASLAELMGTAGAAHATGGSLKLSHLHEILGESMPEMPRNPLGRHRLIQALHQRFGQNFRAIPGVSGLVKQFDDEIAFEKKCAQLRAIKYVPSKKGAK